MSDLTRCAICYHLYNFKNVKNTHAGVLILVKLQAKANGTKSHKASHIEYTMKNRFSSSYEFLTICKNSKKTNYPTVRNIENR